MLAIHAFSRSTHVAVLGRLRDNRHSDQNRCGMRLRTSVLRSIEGGLNMTEGITSLIESGAWKALEAHAATNRTLQLRDLFAQDPTRGERLKVEAAAI